MDEVVGVTHDDNYQSRNPIRTEAVALLKKVKMIFKLFLTIIC